MTNFDSTLSPRDLETKQRAEEFARANKKEIVSKLSNISLYTPENLPISVFMAGSPGAGKTEYSKNLIEILEQDKKRRVVRIDSDDLRESLPGYTGENSSLFQGAVSILSNSIHDAVLKQNQTFLLDGTFSKYDKAKENISRSLDKNRMVFIFYVYQDPKVAWESTRARAIVEGRDIPKEAFIQQFIGARDTISKVRVDHYDSQVTIFLVKKNFRTKAVEDIIELKQESEQSIDQYLGKGYTEGELEDIL